MNKYEKEFYDIKPAILGTRRIKNIELPNIKELVERATPNKKELREEIISELNDRIAINSIFYEYDEDGKAFFLTDNKSVVYERIHMNEYLEENDVILNTLPIKLASKIIKYFELESDNNE